MTPILKDFNAISKLGTELGRVLALPSAEEHRKLAAHTAAMPPQALQDRWFCQVGASLLEAFGDASDVPTSTALRKFAHANVFGDTGRMIASTVRAVLAEASPRRSPREPSISDNVKLAALGAKLQAILGMATGAIPAAAQTALALGLVGGASVGAGTWALNREVQEDEGENEALRGKRDYYQQVAAELRDRLRNDFSRPR